MHDENDDNEVNELLANWEGVYKKGLLTFWLLLLLHERPAYVYEINDQIQSLSQGTISADNNSIYRALNRFEVLGLVKSELQQSDMGPARKYYRLTVKGRTLLARFIQRNILLFGKPAIIKHIRAVLKEARLKSEEG